VAAGVISGVSTEHGSLQPTIAAASSPADRFFQLPGPERRAVFFTLSEDVRAALVVDMSRPQLDGFLDRLDPDEATDVLGYADERTREAALESLEGERRRKTEYLLSFDPESAAGLMSLDYVTVDADQAGSAASERVERFEARTGRLPTVFVTDGEGLVGELPGASLSVAGDGESVAGYVREVPQVRYDREDEAVLETFRANRGRTVAVLDEDDDVVGVLHADDLLAVVEDSAGETLYEFTGVDEGESALDGPAEKVRRRYRWLILNLATAFLAAAVVGLFESTIATVAILAAYMPVVAGMGGNAGTQAMAVTVRGISLGQVSLRTGGRVVVNEVVAGAANGLLTSSSA
jgi:magnesium transporter